MGEYMENMADMAIDAGLHEQEQIYCQGYEDGVVAALEALGAAFDRGCQLATREQAAGVGLMIEQILFEKYNIEGKRKMNS